MHLSWLEPSASALPAAAPCTLDDLLQAGVTCRHLSTDPAVYEPALSALSQENRYIGRDEIGLSPETPDLVNLLNRFNREHLHTLDEVRFVLRGAAIFDIRSVDDRWMRVEVHPGDLLIVPANKYHRFFLTDASEILCVRLFQDKDGWTPQYR